MKGIFVVLFLATVVSYSAPTWNYKQHPEQERRISIGTSPEIQLAKGEKPQFEIVIPEKPTGTASYAAEELSLLLGRCFGVKITPVKAASGKVPAIVVGDPEYAKKAGLDLGKLDRDGYYIKTFEGNVILIGVDDPKLRPTYGGRDSGQHSSLFAAYEFLERFAGVRFYFPGDLGTITPKLDDWKIPSIDISDRPDSTQRFAYCHATPAKYKSVFRPPEFGKFYSREVLRQRRETWNWVGCHGLRHLGYPERFSKTHPEYFAESVDGKTMLGTSNFLAFCYSRGFVEEVKKDAISFLKGEGPEVRGVVYPKKPGKFSWPAMLSQKMPVFDTTPDDGYVPCRCEKCRKIYVNEDGTIDRQKLSDFMWGYYRDVANAVKEAGVNGYITAWSYNPTIPAPPFELPDNILIQVCPRGPWNYKNKAAWDKDMERVRTFGKLSHNNLRLWNYMIKYPWGTMMDVPPVAPHAVAAYYKEVAPYISGAFAETEIERHMYQYLNHYLFYKMLWNADTDVEALLEEHYRLMFGAAASAMKEIYGIIEDTWLSVSGNCVDTPLGPQAVVPSEFDMWTKFYSAELLEKVDALFKKAEALVPAGSKEQKRISLMQRELWQPTIDARADWARDLDQTQNWNCLAVKGTPRKIDGKLDDPAWKKAPAMSLVAPIGNRSRHTNEVRTTVKILFDKDNYYIGFDCEEPLTDQLVASKREPGSTEFWWNATLEVFLNTANDRKGFYQIATDSNGTVTTIHWENKIKIPWKNTARAVNHVEAGKRWQSEFVIPRKEVNDKFEVFPVNFMRNRALMNRKQQIYFWYPFAGHDSLAPAKWGCMHIKAMGNKSIVKDGDFVNLDSWTGAKLRDDKEYLTDGGSVKLDKENSSISQMLPLKPDTEYEVSFYVKLDKLGDDAKGGFRVTFQEYEGKASEYKPRWGTFNHDSHDWKRYRYFIKTSADKRVGIKNSFISFAIVNAKEDGGTAWIDHVEIKESSVSHDGR